MPNATAAPRNITITCHFEPDIERQVKALRALLRRDNDLRLGMGREMQGIIPPFLPGTLKGEGSGEGGRKGGEKR